MHRQGRPIMNKVSFDPKIYKAVLDACNTNTVRLCAKIGISRKTIERAQKSKTINPIILNEIGAELNVDPSWMEGGEFESKWSLNTDDLICEVKLHPYHQFRNIGFNENLYTILKTYGIKKEKINQLSEAELDRLSEELDTAILMVLVRSLFHKKCAKGDPFWNNRKLYHLAVEARHSEAYDHFFELTQL